MAARGRGQARRRSRRTLVIALTIVLIAGLTYLLRGVLLAGLALPLVVADPLARADYLLIAGGDLRYETAARLLRSGEARGIIVFVEAPSRSVRAGLLPDGVTLARRELEGHGVTAAEIVALDADSEPFSPEWRRARALHRWLRANPDTKVALLCPAIGSRRLRIVYSRVLGEQGTRLVFHALDDRRYDTTNWWRSDAGTAAVAAAYASLVQIWLVRSDRPTGEAHDPVTWLASQPGGQLALAAPSAEAAR